MSVNSHIYYYDFAKIYRNFKKFANHKLIDDRYFEKRHYDDIIRLLFCLLEHYDFSKFLKEYNKCRIKDLGCDKNRKCEYVMDSYLLSFVGKYINYNEAYKNNKLGYTCYLLDGILRNMWNWKM